MIINNKEEPSSLCMYMRLNKTKCTKRNFCEPVVVIFSVIVSL